MYNMSITSVLELLILKIKKLNNTFQKLSKSVCQPFMSMINNSKYNNYSVFENYKKSNVPRLLVYVRKKPIVELFSS